MLKNEGKVWADAPHHVPQIIFPHLIGPPAKNNTVMAGDTLANMKYDGVMLQPFLHKPNCMPHALKGSACSPTCQH